MQRVILICCLLASTLFTSCGYYEHKERITLYKEITATNDTLDKMTREWHQLLNRAVPMKNFSILNTTRIKLGQFISKSRSLIADMELPPDAETLRASEGVFLTAQSDMVANIYPQFEAYTELTPDDHIQKSLKLVAKDMDTEYSWKMTIKKSLDAFVLKNRLRIHK